jgi:hypothetical protein
MDTISHTTTALPALADRARFYGGEAGFETRPGAAQCAPPAGIGRSSARSLSSNTLRTAFLLNTPHRWPGIDPLRDRASRGGARGRKRSR